MTARTSDDGRTVVTFDRITWTLVGAAFTAIGGLLAWNVSKTQEISERVARLEGRSDIENRK